MVSGCYIITSDLGALPETSANFAYLIAVDDDDGEIKEDTRLELLGILEAQIQELFELKRDDLRELLENTIKDLSSELL